MTAKNDISEELKGLSGVVAGISRFMPYEGPGTSFFEGLSERILLRIRLEAPGMGTDASGNGGKMPFGGVPEGYFEDFAANMLDKIRRQTVAAPEVGEKTSAEELATLSPLLNSIGKQMPYQVPAGFFENISADEELGPVLASIRHKQPFQIAGDYFERFSEGVLNRVKAGEAQVEGAEVVERGEIRRGKVVSMGGRKGWLRFAGIGVAASAILVFGWLAIQTSMPGKTVETESNSDISKNLTRISDQDIEVYLDSQHTLSDELANSTAAVDISANDLTSMLDDVSDAELKEYMEDHGTVKDLPMN